LIRCFLPNAIENPHDVKHVRHKNKTSQAAALIKLPSWFDQIVALENGGDTQVVDIVNKAWPEYMRKRPRMYTGS
jgi:hypothetical protein